MEAQRIKQVHNEDYYENVVPSPDAFHNHFRMNRITFENLQIQHQRVMNAGINNNTTVSFEKKLLFTIWVLSKPESFLSAGDRFNIAKSTAHQIFFNTIVNSKFITKLLILQAVCNDRKQFIDIFVKMPGRVHDARVFRLCDLFTLLTRDHAAIHENEHFVDAAYPLFPLKPYRDNGHLNETQVRFNRGFNRRMSDVRSMIEQAFGLLKCNFRRLKYLDMARIYFVPNVITAACVLHNCIIMHKSIEAYEENLWVITRQDENYNRQY
ncbi:hypothetical protein NQ317_003996 [Molorchus minor]|uniref:DDE Tnp4 domain-containing protein n=1 Tax=Molorchus minor TaxID=1323400 RepID=A0ABQ9IZX2_9CUCU|nr:hypothetical protein NQ317_003996 [Molorchus minor]